MCRCSVVSVYGKGMGEYESLWMGNVYGDADIVVSL